MRKDWHKLKTVHAKAYKKAAEKADEDLKERIDENPRLGMLLREKYEEEMMRRRGNPNSKEGIKYVQGTGVKEK